MSEHRYRSASANEQDFMMLAARFDSGDATQDLLEPFVFNPHLLEAAFFSQLRELAGR